MPPESATLSPPSASAILPAAWRGPLGALAIVAALLIAVTAHSWSAMLHQWWNIDTYNHLLLVPFITAWLVGLKEEELAALTPQPFWPGLVGVAAALGPHNRSAGQREHCCGEHHRGEARTGAM